MIVVDTTPDLELWTMWVHMTGRERNELCRQIATATLRALGYVG